MRIDLSNFSSKQGNETPKIQNVKVEQIVVEAKVRKMAHKTPLKTDVSMSPHFKPYLKEYAFSDVNNISILPSARLSRPYMVTSGDLEGKQSISSTPQTKKPLEQEADPVPNPASDFSEGVSQIGEEEPPKADACTKRFIDANKQMLY